MYIRAKAGTDNVKPQWKSQPEKRPKQTGESVAATIKLATEAKMKLALIHSDFKPKTSGCD